MDDNEGYRHPSSYAAGVFADTPNEQINESIARIETLKLRLFSNAQLSEFERSEFISELNTLRAAYLHLSALAAQAVRSPDPQGPHAPPLRNRSGLELEGILGSNPRIVDNLDRIARIAPSPLTILLEGETGAGKEMFARIIHLNSRRPKFVAVNCGALPSGVIESELFGHVRGAFTGATNDRKGRFEEAHGGTIFLDEIGEMEPESQVKLLRTLDVGEIQRVGSDKTQKVEVRIIAATNRSLERMVREGRFREDLYFRLNICHLLIPPLRERRDEIPLLLDYFIERTCAEGGLARPTLVPALRDFLIETYHYPGNIRELRNIAQYIAYVHNGEPVRIADLPERYGKAHRDALAGLTSPAAATTPSPATGLRKSVRDDAERGHLVEMLAIHHGDIKALCAALDVSRARLYQLLKKHGLDPGLYRRN